MPRGAFPEWPDGHCGRLRGPRMDNRLDQAPTSPDQAIEQLMAGNRRFTAGEMIAYMQNMSVVQAATAESQAPYAAILACADSRVPIGMVFDETIGRLFVARIAGSTATSEIVASLEYAVAILGVQAIVVLGHSNCGAIKAAMKNTDAPGQISALYAGILPAIYLAGERDIDHVTEQHVLNQVGLLINASTVIAAGMAAGKLKVIGGLYDVATGEVKLLRRVPRRITG